MEKLTVICTCDDNCDSPCPAHCRENALQNQLLEALEEIKQWKEAFGLEAAGGNPDGITPAACREYWDKYRRVHITAAHYDDYMEAESDWHREALEARRA